MLIMVAFCSPCAQKQEMDYFSSSHIRIFFSPTVNLNLALAKYIDDAQSSINACFYAINSEEVAHALIKAHLKGVKVQIVIDEGRIFEEESFYPKLKNFGLVRKDTITKGLMHDKFCIIDGRIVWTGSYNPNSYAVYENNDAVAIESEELANIYTQAFETLWGDIDSNQAEEHNNSIRLDKDIIA